MMLGLECPVVGADVELAVEINAVTHRTAVPPRMTLADFLRERQGLTGTHLGCEQGVCGACTVLVDGRSVRSCLMFAVQANGSQVTTVEGLTAPDRPLSELQQAFADHDALQCGFCTPGFLMTCSELLTRDELDEDSVRSALSGNLCRCTGYAGIVAAVLEIHAAGGPIAARPQRACVDSDEVPEWVSWEPQSDAGRGSSDAAPSASPRRVAVAVALGGAASLIVAALWVRRRLCQR